MRVSAIQDIFFLGGKGGRAVFKSCACSRVVEGGVFGVRTPPDIYTCTKKDIYCLGVWCSLPFLLFFFIFPAAYNTPRNIFLAVPLVGSAGCRFPSDARLFFVCGISILSGQHHCFRCETVPRRVLVIKQSTASQTGGGLVHSAHA